MAPARKAQPNLALRFFAAVGHWLRRREYPNTRQVQVKKIQSQEIAGLLMQAQELLEMKQGDLGDYMGYSKSFVSAVANGHLEPSKTLILLLETLIENHQLKQEVARVRGAAAELMGAAMPHPRHTEAPSTLNRTASSGAREPQRQTPAEIFESAKQKVLAQIPQAAAPTSPKPKPVRETKPPASSGPPAKGSRP